MSDDGYVRFGMFIAGLVFLISGSFTLININSLDYNILYLPIIFIMAIGFLLLGFYCWVMLIFI